jgi:hypothetical protein
MPMMKSLNIKIWLNTLMHEPNDQIGGCGKISTPRGPVFFNDLVCVSVSLIP